MSYGWILVVLQATANYVERDRQPMKYLCIRQSRSSN